MHTVSNNYRVGIRDGMPIGIGYLAISFAFGISAVTAGLTIPEALLISAFNLTSAGQLAAVPIIAACGPYIELALTQLLINLRYSLMSISLSQRFDKEIRLAERFYLAFALTDEIFAVGIGREQKLGRKYLIALMIPPYVGWTLGTLLGAVAGSLLPEIVVSSLGVAMYAMFIAIVVPAGKASPAVALCALISIALSCLFAYTPVLDRVQSGFVIIISALVASIVMALLFPIKDEEVQQDE